MIERVRLWLQWPEEEVHRLEALIKTPSSPVPFTLPGSSDARDLLARMDVPPHAVDEMVAVLPAVRADPEAWWLLERLFDAVVDPVETTPPPWPAPPETDDTVSRYFHLYVFLAAVAHVMGLHASRGIPDSVTWDTLRDVGLQVANYQLRTGRPGFDGAFWVWKHFRGNLFTLGRLQFDPKEVTFEGEPALDVHIPALGPLTSAACDDAFDRARTFCSLHYPELELRIALCRSWLMDEQLAEYLPADSNIVRFQRRFTNVPGWSRIGDDDVQRFVFGFLPPSIDEIPQRTTLERAVATHLRSGRHWYIHLGRLYL